MLLVGFRVSSSELRQLKLPIVLALWDGSEISLMGGLKRSSKGRRKMLRRQWISVGEDRPAPTFKTWLSNGKSGKENSETSESSTDLGDEISQSAITFFHVSGFS